MISTGKYAKLLLTSLEIDGTGYRSKQLKYIGYGKQNATQILRLERGELTKSGSYSFSNQNGGRKLSRSQL